MSTNPFHTPDYHGDIAPKGCVVQYRPERESVPRPGTSPARFYGPRVPGGEPWLQMDDGSWLKWHGDRWISEGAHKIVYDALGIHFFVFAECGEWVEIEEHRS